MDPVVQLSNAVASAVTRAISDATHQQQPSQSHIPQQTPALPPQSSLNTDGSPGIVIIANTIAISSRLPSFLRRDQQKRKKAQKVVHYNRDVICCYGEGGDTIPRGLCWLYKMGLQGKVTLTSVMSEDDPHFLSQWRTIHRSPSHSSKRLDVVGKCWWLLLSPLPSIGMHRKFQN